jgi:hypothetical protein
MTERSKRTSSAFRWRSLLVVACTGAFSVALGGCYARAGTGAVVTAEYVPPRVETYPSYRYDGRVVYLVGDRWYYREGPHWVYYAHEPEVLVRRRIHVREQGGVHRAPPAYPRRHAPPGRHRERRRHHHH